MKMPERPLNSESLKRSMQYVMSVYGIHTDMDGILLEVIAHEDEMDIPNKVRLLVLADL